MNNWYLVAAAAVSGGMLLMPMLKPGQQGLSPAEAVQLMNKQKAWVIDVCEPDEFAKGHVKGARNVPLSGLKAEAKGLPCNKQQAVIVVCAAGVRAGKAAAQLKALGYENVQALAGGLRAWQDAQLPVESASA